jgi:hypothetical protein
MKKMIKIRTLAETLGTSEGSIVNTICAVDPSAIVRLPSRVYINIEHPKWDDIYFRLFRLGTRRKVVLNEELLSQISENDTKELLEKLKLEEDF